MLLFAGPAWSNGALVGASERVVTRAMVTLEAQRAASRRLRDKESLRRPMRLMNVQAVVSYALDSAEHARRQCAGAGPVLSPDVLDLLLGLPVGRPVPVSVLTARERGALRTAPRWAVQVVNRLALRLAVPPVSVGLVLVAAKSWRSGLDVAGRFTPFCTRAIVLDSRPRDDQEMRMEADFYGVGVTVVEDEHVDVLVRPTPFRPLRPTAAGWRFLERVYEQHLEQEVSAPGPGAASPGA